MELGERAFRALENASYYEAITAFSKLLSKDGSLTCWLAWRSQCNMAVGHYHDALDDAMKILVLDPQNSWAHLNIALLKSTSPIADHRDAATALKHLKAFRANFSGETTWRIDSIRAAVYAENRDFETALRYSRRSLETAPNEMKKRCQARIELYNRRMPMRIDTFTIKDALGFHELKYHICGTDAVFRIPTDKGKSPVCCDCNWGKLENAG